MVQETIYKVSHPNIHSDHTCVFGKVKCAGGLQCISWYPKIICDGIFDCLDGSDESDTTCKGLFSLKFKNQELGSRFC